MKGKSKKNRERNIVHFLYVLPNLILYSLLSIVPIILGLYYSFTNWNGISKKYKMVGFSNYIKILKDSRFRKAVSFNLRYAVMLIICVMLISVILALLLNAKTKGQNFFRAVYFFPACVSMLTIGLIFNYIFFQGVPGIGEALGIESLQKNILSGRNTAIYGILITNVWKSVAIPTVLVISALQTIPAEIMEAATVDGANGRQRFFYITLRYILPILSIIFVLLLKEGLMIYDYIMALTSGGPAGATESITLSIYRLGFEDMKFGYAISQAMIVAFIIAVISIIQIKFTDKKKIYD
ncbi:ABC transporter permease subunit [Clostridium sp. MCC353]|uniref:carbohydrate ABC transporter permease n=1 Tax=Clostridium sp. MCC353 TaxID=2592646 RepID=UPI001C02B6AF|nr:ABC transporter permease subunit [Clostridium sp. MCC353]